MSLWLNSLVIDNGNGNLTIISQSTAVNKAFKIAVSEVENQTGLSLK